MLVQRLDDIVAYIDIRENRFARRSVADELAGNIVGRQFRIEQHDADIELMQHAQEFILIDGRQYIDISKTQSLCFMDAAC